MANAKKSESVEALPGRAHKLFAILHGTYPGAECSLDYATPLQLLVATILSAQCTDARVNLVTKSLFQKYRTAAEFAHAPAGELETEIRSTGFYKNKAKAIRLCCADLIAKYHGQVPDTMAALHALPGVGRKTASVVLGNAFGKAEGVVVDTHVMRLSQRLGLTKQKTPEKIEQDLMKRIPQKDWIEFSHLLIFHGRNRCRARNPDCAHCEAVRLCPQVGIQQP